jgi:RND family efflux transporter MFP subunit
LITIAALFSPIAFGCSRERADSQSGGKNGSRSAGGKPPVAVEIAVANVDSLSEAIAVVGSLTPKLAADIRSEVSGTVLEIAVTEWVPVKKGRALARLDGREAEAAVAAARAALLQAEANETRAVREADRCERLRTAGLATQQMLDDARTVRDAAAASTAAAKAQLAAVEYRLEKTVIRAPFDGVVASRSIDVGDYVESMGAPRPLFQVVDNRLLDLTVTVPSTKSALLRAGQRLEFTTDALPDRTFVGTVAHINPVVDESTRTIKVIAEVPNADGALRGGLFVSGRIEIGGRFSRSRAASRAAARCGPARPLGTRSRSPRAFRPANKLSRAAASTSATAIAFRSFRHPASSRGLANRVFSRSESCFSRTSQSSAPCSRPF